MATKKTSWFPAICFLLLAAALTACVADQGSISPQNPPLQEDSASFQDPLAENSQAQGSQEGSSFGNNPQTETSIPKNANDLESMPQAIYENEQEREFQSTTMWQTIENDGRQTIMNSGCSWLFILQEKHIKQDSLKERTRCLLGIDIEQYLGEGVDVLTLDTLPIGQSSWDSKITYLFVFQGDDLLYQEKFEDYEHFSAVFELCMKLSS